MIKIVFVMLLAVYLVGCAQGHCRRIERDATVISTNEKSENLPTNTRQLKVFKKRVLVFKYDESKQCQAWAGITLEQMERDLEPVKVLSRKKKRDGFERIQVCGSTSGIANVYEIYEDDLETALKKGFQLWKFD